MTDLFGNPEGATPLDPDERNGLRLSWVSTLGDLNKAEQTNIEAAMAWVRRAKHREILSVQFLQGLHKRMFGDVWTWAGTYRTTPRNIGVDAWKIGMELSAVPDRIQYWIENETYPFDEIAVRFHHSLVLIHPFPNGNGRWSRLAANLLIQELGGERFSWGGTSLGPSSEARTAYIAALRVADKYNIGPLLDFARA